MNWLAFVEWKRVSKHKNKFNEMWTRKDEGHEKTEHQKKRVDWNLCVKIQHMMWHLRPGRWKMNSIPIFRINILGHIRNPHTVTLLVCHRKTHMTPKPKERNYRKNGERREKKNNQLEKERKEKKMKTRNAI